MSRASLVLLVTTLLLAAPGQAAAGGVPSGTCSGDTTTTHPFTVDVAGQPARGRYALPAATPDVLVVFAHGYSHRVEGWARHLARVAARDGALTVAMNYRGLTDLPPDAGGVPRSRGYPVKTGAEDLNAAALAMLAACPSLRRVVLFGVSMGGNVSGVALALQPRRPDGRPLYDHWIGVEGAFNLIELYEGSRVVTQISDFAAAVKEDIEKETGGTPETQPAAYAERTVVARSAEIAAAGLQGVTLVHGVEDGLAPYDNGFQLTQLLRAAGTPTDFVTVTRRGAGDDPDTTLAGYAGQTTGFAGHGGELSEKHAVIDTGFARLHALLSTSEPRPCGRDITYDGFTRTLSPDPAVPSDGCPPGAPLVTARAATGNGTCTDRTAPTLGRPRATVSRGRRLTLRGTVGDRACGLDNTAAVRVDVVISRPLGRSRCRFVTSAGRLGRSAPCARRSRVRVRRAGAAYVLELPRALPRGRYAIRVTARDAAGHAVVRTLRLRVR